MFHPTKEIRLNEKKEERQVMSNNNNSGRNKIMVPNAREAMNKFKMEAANERGVTKRIE